MSIVRFERRRSGRWNECGRGPSGLQEGRGVSESDEMGHGRWRRPTDGKEVGRVLNEPG